MTSDTLKKGSAANKAHTWLQLFRAPNLFTVPGDPIAGYLIAYAGFFDTSIVFVTMASLAFYGAGLLLNDLIDIAEDRAERPNRPLPSGQVSPTTVRRGLPLPEYAHGSACRSKPLCIPDRNAPRRLLGVVYSGGDPSGAV
ncbi:MAG: hypothetical protein EBS01_02380 [Verrucomicrobia bacterium]|nr:hypothetical protein [Verrucomicrobiota bacterium]